jgi:phosphate-selective porin OprO/OprP
VRIYIWWGLGAFKEVDDDDPFDFGHNQDGNLSGRITGLPWYADHTKLLHVGLSYVHKFRDQSTDEDKQLVFKAVAESNLAAASEMVDTGTLLSNGADIVNPELALVFGPFSVQGEYFYTRVARDTNADLSFNGYYGYASYFLTGESRDYYFAESSFGKVKPNKDFGLKKGSGWGAWEVGLRYSYVDLNDEEIQGGEEKNITVGLNWYLNPYVAFKFNYVHAHVEETNAGIYYLEDGDTNIFQMRFQMFL